MLTVGMALGSNVALADAAGNAAAAAPPQAPQAHSAALASTAPAVESIVRWAHEFGDARGRPFAVVDKSAARIHVHAAGGRWLGSAPVLLGLARGDASAPGVGTRVQSGIPGDERTTPAGRFASAPGRNLQGEAIVWVDYEAAVAIHRLRPAHPSERRPQRLASATAADNRITLGCIVVDGDFYDRVVAVTLGRQGGVVYVLPDTLALGEVFGPLAGSAESF